ncbi:hypothetical protein MJO55_07370 [Mycolicibacterium rufum]|uniref:Uncharacterized protein n=1 Tax=Mycolicibacterium rufum TaxID=318424 RepID=A0A9X3BSK1_9MYCO|nr:hypothetical protein [Mycolicibacterium rufum]MCV7073450.1 hypothetical protein [Mycolicibacterium rufum]ULP38238.1 hypothetical protein MJO55_07370 [Mycolicibacterium rufum]
MITEVSPVRPNARLSLIVWLLPSSRFKVWALRRLGNCIGRNATLAPNLVLNCGRFELGDDVFINQLNVFRNLAGVRMGDKAIIGSMNQITASPDYQRFSRYVGLLLIEKLGAITNRHYIDCSGQVIIKQYAAIGGVKGIFQSHEIDLAEDKTTVGRVILDEYSISTTAVLMLRDSRLPARSVLAAGALMAKQRDGSELPVSQLYAGIPAKPVAPVGGFAWWQRQDHVTAVTPFNDEVFKSC